MVTSDEYRAAEGTGLFDTLKWFYGYETVRALSAVPRAGFAVPWSGAVGSVGNIFARGAGYKTAFNTNIRIGTGMARTGIEGVAGRHASKFGIIGTMKKMGTTKSPILFRELSKNLIGKAAGMSLRLLHMYWGLELVGMAAMGYHALAQRVRSERGLELGGYFPETRGSITSRQRTVRAISDSRLQARSAVGNEAMLFHR